MKILLDPSYRCKTKWHRESFFRSSYTHANTRRLYCPLLFVSLCAACFHQRLREPFVTFSINTSFVQVFNRVNSERLQRVKYSRSKYMIRQQSKLSSNLLTKVLVSYSCFMHCLRIKSCTGSCSHIFVENAETAVEDHLDRSCSSEFL